MLLLHLNNLQAFSKFLAPTLSCKPPRHPGVHQVPPGRPGIRPMTWNARRHRMEEPPPVELTVADVAARLDQFSHALPSLVVFDLDYTLWPFWCEMYSPKDTPSLYPHVTTILEALEARCIRMALASRTPTPHVANAFLDKLQLRHRFCSIQLIPAANGYDQLSAQKDKAHLPAIQRETNIPYAAMLFFDDEHGNVKKVTRLGVTSILVDTSTGLCLAALEKGLQAFADAHQAEQAASL